MTEPKLYKCELLDETLKKTYGHFRYFDYERARQGEARGKWRIVQDSKQFEEYENRMMVAGQTKIGYQTKGVKKTKVAWVQDNEIMRNGGAEISNREVMRAGIHCGFDVSPVIPARFSTDELNNADVIILNNLFGFDDREMQKIRYALYEERIPYVKYEHDYRELQRPEFSRILFQNSHLNVFISPKHLKDYQEGIYCDGVCIPLAIDVDMFKPVEGVERKPNTALASNIRNIRQWRTLKDYILNNPDITFDILGEDIINGNNVRHLGRIKHEDMPKLYSEHEYFVHLLDEPRAGERVIFEAILCGCKIVANDNVGHISWGLLDDIDTLKQALRQAPYAFWREVEGILG